MLSSNTELFVQCVRSFWSLFTSRVLDLINIKLGETMMYLGKSYPDLLE